jgi:hypothetical protein
MKRIEPIYLSQLEKIEILWPDDIRTLAEFMLRACDARDQEINAQTQGSKQRSRPILRGLAGSFASLTHISRERVEHTFNGYSAYQSCPVR